MDHGKKNSSGSREASKKAPPLGLVIALAAAGGVIVGSAGTYFLFKPLAPPIEAASPAVAGTPPAPSAAPSVTMTPQQPPQFTPAPQPPGEAPPGKVWSPEHGHWHDAPVTQITPAPAVPAVNLPAPTPAPTAVPAGK